MFEHEFLKLSECSDSHQFKSVINIMVSGGWELVNVIGMHTDLVAWLRTPKKVKISP